MLVALLLVAQQPRTVTFVHPCAHSSVVLEALGKEIGVPMKPTGSVMRDYVLLRFDKVPVDEALRKMAEVFNATWTESNGVRYLGRTKQQEDAGPLKLQAELEKSVAEYIAKDALKVTSWSSARAMDLMRDTIGADGTMNRQKGTETANKTGPCRELLDEFLRTVGAKKLVAIPEGKDTVFRWAPGKGEEKISPTLRPKAELFVKNIVAFGAAMTSAGVPLYGDFDLPGEVRLAGSKDLTADSICFRVRRHSGSLSALVSPNGQNPSWFAQANMQVGRVSLSSLSGREIEGDYVPSEVARTVSERAHSSWNGKGTRLDDTTEVGKGVVKWFEDGLSPEPIQVFFGEVATEIAERGGLNIVACFPDYHSYGSTYTRSPSTPYSKVLAEMEQYFGVKVEGNWVVRPSPTIRPDYRPVGTLAISRFSLSVFRKGWATIDAIAELASSCESAMSFHSGRQFANVLQPTPYGFNWNLYEGDRLALDLYHSLPSAAKRQAREDWVNYPFEDLPSELKGKLIAATLGKSFGSSRSGQEPSARWGGFTHNGAFVGEKQRAAADLSRAVFEVHIESKELLTAQDKVVGNQHFSSGMHSAEEAAKNYVSSRDEQEPSLDYGTLAAFTAERLQMRVKLAGGELLYFIFTTDSRNSETRYYPIAQVPGEIGDKLRAEVKRLGG